MDATLRRAQKVPVELGLVLATGAFHVVFENVLYAKAYYLPAAGLFWVLYVLGRVRRDPACLRVWGFRRDNLSGAFVPAAGMALLGILLLLPVGRYLGHPVWNAHIWLTLAAYPVWALAQQFLLNAMLVRNLRSYLGPVATVFTAALLFALAHAPDLAVMALSFAGGIMWTALYLYRPNLWVLTGLHSLLGTLTYHMVLGRDPWVPLLG